MLGLPVDPRADLFSLGIVLYEMLVNRNPFQRDTDTVFSLMHRIAGEPHQDVAGWGRKVPPGLARVVDRALAKKPEERYQRAAEMAKDLRNYGSAEEVFEKTLVLPKKPVHIDLLTDLDKFSENYDREQQQRAQEEAKELRRRQEEKEALQRAWQLPDDLLKPEPEPAPRAEPRKPPVYEPSAAVNEKRRAMLERLEKQAAAQPAREDPNAARDRALAKLDAAMREADRFLIQIANQVNSVHPASDLPFDVLYLGRIPSVKLSEASVRARYERAGEREVIDSIKLAWRVTPALPHTATLHRDDIARGIRYLKEAGAEHKALAERRNDFGQPIKAQVTLTGSLPCEVLIRADYADDSLSIELTGVRRIGRYRAELDSGELEDAVDELVRYMLGVDDEFEKRLVRAG